MTVILQVGPKGYHGILHHRALHSQMFLPSQLHTAHDEKVFMEEGNIL
jgi:hypothetical protein